MCIKRKKPLYNRILLKISGQSFQKKNTSMFGIDILSIKRIASEIKVLLECGIEIGVLLGGGNLFRGYDLKQRGLSNVISDQIGVLSTVINSLAFKDIIQKLSVKTCLMSSFPIGNITEIYNYEKAMDLLSNKYVVIFSAGIGNPFFSTDLAACLRGIEIQADVVLKGTKVNGIYNCDPEKHLPSKMYKLLSYDFLLKKELKIMDISAICLARDYKIPIRVFNINKMDSLMRVVFGEKEGTTVM
ncbi:Uridylate kinase [Buchnera aphidicola (Tetraneura ulmi)]|uniref:UMP kinase n=1 Tax=Buchnera aphidicola TaxID=9 RepID=UPI003464ACF1